jgi:hypothetical protein
MRMLISRRRQRYAISQHGCRQVIFSVLSHCKILFASNMFKWTKTIYNNIKLSKINSKKTKIKRFIVKSLSKKKSLKMLL